MNEQALISVIVPVYNVARYLDKCIDSIVKQTYENLEIILVDDGSTDQSGSLCDKWAKKDARIKVIHKENGGLSDARNVGVRHALGAYIGFVDSDDFIHPKMYELLYNAITLHHAEMAICNYRWIDDAGKTLKYFPDLKNEALEPEECLDKLAKKHNVLYVTAWNKLYQKMILERHPFPKGRINEDEFTVHHFIAQCSKIATIEDDCYYYLQRDNSIMSNAYSVKRLDAVYAMLDRYSFFRSRDDRTNAYRALIRSYAILCDALYKLPFAENKKALNKAVWEVMKRLKFNLRNVKLFCIYLKAMLRRI